MLFFAWTCRALELERKASRHGWARAADLPRDGAVERGAMGVCGARKTCGAIASSRSVPVATLSNNFSREHGATSYSSPTPRRRRSKTLARPHLSVADRVAWAARRRRRRHADAAQAGTVGPAVVWEGSARARLRRRRADARTMTKMLSPARVHQDCYARMEVTPR